MDVFSLNREILRFDPGLALEAAEGPPASWYRDAAFFEREQLRVLRRSWVPVARRDQLAAPRSYVATEIHGEPVVLTRGHDGVLHAFANVCRHRGALLATGEGSCARLICARHGWSYSHEGQLFATPGISAAARLRVDASLPEHTIALLGPEILVHEGRPERALEAECAGIEHFLGLDQPRSLNFLAEQRAEVACNWKLLVETSLDGGVSDRGSDERPPPPTEIAPKWSVQGLRAGPEDGVLCWIYPNLLCTRVGGLLEVAAIAPVDPQRCRAVVRTYVDGAATRQHAEADQVVLRDLWERRFATARSSMNGVMSHAFCRGPYLTSERPVLAFHQLLARDLSLDAS